MKKFIKILLIIIVVLFVILLVTPFLFKGKIMEVAKQQINENINAKVEFSDLGLSFIKNFPNASVSLKKLSVAGIDKFEGDTLLKLNSFDVRVDIISAIKMENIKVKRKELVMENYIWRLENLYAGLLGVKKKNIPENIKKLSIFEYGKKDTEMLLK